VAAAAAVAAREAAPAVLPLHPSFGKNGVAVVAAVTAGEQTRSPFGVPAVALSASAYDWQHAEVAVVQSASTLQTALSATVPAAATAATRRANFIMDVCLEL